MPLLDPQMSAKLGTLQSLDDAIAYRLSRLDLPCQDCGPGSRCVDHRSDEQLVANYQGRYATALRDALAGMDPDDVALIMQPGDDIPTTAAVFSLAIMAQLRELAADGPAVVELDGGPVLIELDGAAVLEYPPDPDDGS